jgi:hypothetical protein
VFDEVDELTISEATLAKAALAALGDQGTTTRIAALSTMAENATGQPRSRRVAS